MVVDKFGLHVHDLGLRGMCRSSTRNRRMQNGISGQSGKSRIIGLATTKGQIMDQPKHAVHFIFGTWEDFTKKKCTFFNLLQALITFGSIKLTPYPMRGSYISGDLDVHIRLVHNRLLHQRGIQRYQPHAVSEQAFPAACLSHHHLLQEHGTLLHPAHNNLPSPKN